MSAVKMKELQGQGPRVSSGSPELKTVKTQAAQVTLDILNDGRVPWMMSAVHNDGLPARMKIGSQDGEEIRSSTNHRGGIFLQHGRAVKRNVDPTLTK
jgi:hypothetical protein